MLFNFGKKILSRSKKGKVRGPVVAVGNINPEHCFTKRLWGTLKGYNYPMVTKFVDDGIIMIVKINGGEYIYDPISDFGDRLKEFEEYEFGVDPKDKMIPVESLNYFPKVRNNGKSKKSR